METMMMTAEEVASALRMSPVTIRAWARQGRLVGARIGLRWLFDRAAVEAMLAGVRQGRAVGRASRAAE